MQRVVSLLPSATEILYELGVGDQIFGVTHECTYPAEAATKPQMIMPAIDMTGMTSSQINAATYKILNQRQDIFVLDEEKFKVAKPDIIISQETCEACAAHTENLGAILDMLPKRPMVHSMNPKSLSDILYSIIQLGDIMKVAEKAKKITNALEVRINKIKTMSVSKRPKVLAV